MAKKISGTAEWAVANANCVIGCAHDCRYCYARYNAVDRFKRVKPGEWPNEKVDVGRAIKKWRKVGGTVMFPTTHDITPNTKDAETLEACIACLHQILKAGNDVLIVSKPHMECIRRICVNFSEYKHKILFRFTIGAIDNNVLRYWEPNAPSFGERLDCLQHAFDAGFQTSVSCEPMLYSDGMVQLFDVLEPYVTDGIWIGKMNNMRSRVKILTDEDAVRVREIEQGQTNVRIREIYEALKDDPKVRWKDSFKDVLGLEKVTKAGEDK